MDLLAKAAGKWLALRTLSQQAYYFQNWQEVFSCYRSGQKLPTLVTRNDLRIEHRDNDDIWSLFREVFIDKCYTKEFYFPSPSDTVMDIGANIGLFSLFVSRLAPGIKVHCFEPDPDNLVQLEKNLRLNQLTQTVAVHPVAVFDQEGEVDIVQMDYAGDNFVVNQGSGGAKRLRVPCVSLRKALELAGSKSISLVKMDIEGAEVEALERASTADFQKIKCLVLEYHEVNRPGTMKTLMDLLSENFKHVRFRATAANNDLGLIWASHT